MASSSEDRHPDHLREVFGHLKDGGLAMNRSKCVLGLPQVWYLGQEVSAAGLAPLARRLEDIAAMDCPGTKVELTWGLSISTIDTCQVLLLH